MVSSFPIAGAAIFVDLKETLLFNSVGIDFTQISARVLCASNKEQVKTNSKLLKDRSLNTISSISQCRNLRNLASIGIDRLTRSSSKQIPLIGNLLRLPWKQRSSAPIAMVDTLGHPKLQAQGREWLIQNTGKRVINCLCLSQKCHDPRAIPILSQIQGPALPKKGYPLKFYQTQLAHAWTSRHSIWRYNYQESSRKSSLRL